MSLFVGLGLALAIQIVLFIPAFIFKTDKLTDFSYGLTFLILAWFYTSYSTPHFILLGMITIWALRIAFYLIKRLKSMGRDKRFDTVRDSFPKFLTFWLMQGITVWIIMIPSIWYFQSNSALSLLSYLGVAVWVIGFLFESIADYQKYNFKLAKNEWIQTGLWKYSRHPNYFGEILCWVGIYLYTLPVLDPSQRYTALLSPLYIAFILIFLTGIPKLEKSADEKWGKLKAYQNYKERTNVLIPFFQKD